MRTIVRYFFIKLHLTGVCSEVDNYFVKKKIFFVTLTKELYSFNLPGINKHHRDVYG
jgi:hypothetical protein